MFLLVPFRIQASDRHGRESEKEGMWLKIGEIGAVGGLLPCLPFGPGPGLGLVGALPPIWSDLTTDAGDKRIHHRRWEKFKGGLGGQVTCGACAGQGGQGGQGGQVDCGTCGGQGLRWTRSLWCG